MRYPVLIHHEEGSAYGVTVPDIPGCFSAGDTLDEALDNTRLPIEFHLEGMATDGEVAPAASNISVCQQQDEYKDGIWALVEVDITPFMGKSEKVTITLPAILIRKIDEEVKKGHGKNRSAWLADSAMRQISQ